MTLFKKENKAMTEIEFAYIHMYEDIIDVELDLYKKCSESARKDIYEDIRANLNRIRNADGAAYRRNVAKVDQAMRLIRKADKRIA